MRSGGVVVRNRLDFRLELRLLAEAIQALWVGKPAEEAAQTYRQARNDALAFGTN